MLVELIRNVAVLSWLVGAVLLMGCSTTMRMAGGGSLDGDLESSDEPFVYVVLDEKPKNLTEERVRSYDAQIMEGPDGERDGNRRLHRVPRSAIKEFELAGRGLGIAGAVITTIGLIPMLGGLTSFVTCGGQGLCGTLLAVTALPGGIISAIGIPMTIYGWTIYGQSAAAIASPTITVAPLVDATREDPRGGLRIVTTW